MHEGLVEGGVLSRNLNFSNPINIVIKRVNTPHNVFGYYFH